MRQPLLRLGALLGVVTVASAPLGEPASALPNYAQRSGRTCANCHVSPTYQDEEGWENPDLAHRKCNLSCLSCHVDPTGGGLRNASGRYYGQSVLPMLPSQERGYGDMHREVFSQRAVHAFRSRFDRGRVGEGKTIPSDWDEVQDGVGQGQRGRFTAFGTPLGGDSRMSYWDGRYDDLNADPLVQIGGDFRLAYWSGSNAVFPMQADLDVAIQPVDHFTAMVTLAGRGKNTGFVPPTQQARGPVFPRRAFVMAHELPYASWVKAGIFLPSYGLYLDDHTAFTREWIEQDTSDSLDTVLGVEIGTAPNYPYATLSVFQNDASFGLDDDPGWGVAATAGVRELGWNVGGNVMVKQRGKQARGDLIAAGVTWGYNPVYYNDAVPLTILGELSATHRSTQSGNQTAIASTTEAWWLVKNGVNLRGRVDLGVRNLGSAPFESRVSVGGEVVPVPGATLTLMTRLTVRAGEEGASPGVLGMFHVWF